MKPPGVRDEVVDALRLDLVGSDSAPALARELLPDAPSRWQLTGFLLRSEEAPVAQKSVETATEGIDSGGDSQGTGGASPRSRAAARRNLLLSSIGLSLQVAPGVATLQAIVTRGDSACEGALNEPDRVKLLTATKTVVHDERASGWPPTRSPMTSGAGDRQEPRTRHA